MPNKENEYYYIDINVKTMKIVTYGISNTAALTGDTEMVLKQAELFTQNSLEQ